jgi:hypothetical protein
VTPLITGVAVPKAHLGPFETEAREFLALARHWLSDPGSDIVRVAFGGFVVYPAGGRAEAYRLLARYAPSLKVDPERSKDVLYRVNWPKESRHGIALNRMTTWSVITRTTDVSSTGSNLLRVSEEYYLLMEFDHNTPAERTEPLEPGTIVPIFEELLEWAIENAFQGECT